MKVLLSLWKVVLFLLGSCVFLSENLRAETNAVFLGQWSLRTIATNAVAHATFTVSNQVVRVNASGGVGVTNGIHFVFQRMEGDGQIVVRVPELSENQAVKAGVMIRENLENNSRFAWMLAKGEKAIFERCLEPAQKSFRTIATNVIPPRWLRLVREGTAVSGFFSNDGTNWVQISADTIRIGDVMYAGLASDGEAAFDHIQITSARLKRPSQNAHFTLPTNIVIEAVIANSGSRQSNRVEFFTEAEKIGEAREFPYSMNWSNALAGVRSVFAKITDDSSAQFFTGPVSCKISLPPAQAEFIGVDAVTRGDWKNRYGADGFCLVRHATNLPAYAEISLGGPKSVLLTYSGAPDALQLTNGNEGIIAQWFTYSNMTVNVSLLDGHSHQVAFYCHDSDSNLRVQQIELIDSVTRSILDTRKLANFHIGKYLIWKVRGTIKFRITSIAGNAVVNGIFFDTNSRPRTEQSP